MNFTDLTSFKKPAMSYPLMWRGGLGILFTYYNSAYFLIRICLCFEIHLTYSSDWINAAPSFKVCVYIQSLH